MRKSQFTESRIVAFIRRHEQGEPVVDVCRDGGISQGTFYQWKAKYSGMDSSQLKK
jgi:putative transposase